MFSQIFKIFLVFLCCFQLAFAQNEVPKVLPAINDSTFIYESNLSFKKTSFGGLLITKKQEDKLRVTLTSKFGMKIFDYLLGPDSLEVLFTVDPLDRKIIQKILYKDFRMLYPFLFKNPKIIVKEDKIVLKNKCKKYRYFKNEFAFKQIKKGNGATKVEFQDKNDELEVIHSLIGLKIKIKPLILLHE